MKKTIITLGIILLLVLVGCQSRIIEDEDKEDRTVSVTGNSEFEVEPDTVEIIFAVETNASEAEAAQEENSKITNDVISELKSIGMSEDEIETLNYNLYPEYEYNPETRDREQTGYRVTNSVKVKTEKTERAGEIIDSAVKGGANRISNIQFTLSKDKEKEENQVALQRAGEDAKAKAENLALGLGLNLGEIKNVRESNVNVGPYPVRYLEGAAADEATQKVAETPISPGKVTIRASVSVDYGLE